MSPMHESLVVIGASLGGLAALRVVLGALPHGYPLPVAVAQHRSSGGLGSLDGLASVLRRWVELPVVDAEDKAPLEPGWIVLAPADYHLLVERDHFALSTDESVSYARPSVDVLFESAADSHGAGVVAVVLTGAGRDGARGVKAVRRAGGRVLVQEPSTAEAPAMPQAALDALGLDAGQTLEELADELVRIGGAAGGGEVRERPGAREDIDRR